MSLLRLCENSALHCREKKKRGIKQSSINSLVALKPWCLHQDLHTQSHPSTASQGGLGRSLRVVVLHGIVPSFLPFIYSVKHDTCINSGRILELCVPHTICFPVNVPLLSKKRKKKRGEKGQTRTQPPPSAVSRNTTRGQSCPFERLKLLGGSRPTVDTQFKITFNPHQHAVFIDFCHSCVCYKLPRHCKGWFVVKGGLTKPRVEPSRTK